MFSALLTCIYIRSNSGSYNKLCNIFVAKKLRVTVMRSAGGIASRMAVSLWTINGEEDIEIVVYPSGQSLHMIWGPPL